MIPLLTLAIPANQVLPQRVVFTGSQHSESNVFVVGVDGTGLKRLTKEPGEYHEPTWSPDGSTVIFTRIPGHKPNEVRSNGHLWSIRSDGTNLKQLTRGPFYDSMPTWSVDGKRIYFYRQGPPYGIYCFDLGSQKLTKSTWKTWMLRPSPSRKWYVYLRPETDGEDEHRYDLWLARSQNEAGRRLTHYRSSISDPQWSPDGRVIACRIEANSNWLALISIPSGAVKSIANGRGISASNPLWSPDGRRLAFEGDQPNYSGRTNARNTQIYIVNVDGTGLKRLTDNSSDVSLCGWTRDGKSIVTWRFEGEGKLVVVGAHTSRERVINTYTTIYEPLISR